MSRKKKVRVPRAGPPTAPPAAASGCPPAPQSGASAPPAVQRQAPLPRPTLLHPVGNDCRSCPPTTDWRIMPEPLTCGPSRRRAAPSDQVRVQLVDFDDRVGRNVQPPRGGED